MGFEEVTTPNIEVIKEEDIAAPVEEQVIPAVEQKATDTVVEEVAQPIVDEKVAPAVEEATSSFEKITVPSVAEQIITPTSEETDLIEEKPSIDKDEMEDIKE